MSRVWFVTGAGRGMGRAWVEAALERGDWVVATSRDAGSLQDLPARFGDAVVVEGLDVTDREAVGRAVERVRDRFGRLDVVVNNAGTGHDGVIEDVSEADARAAMGTTFFGALWVTQAAVRVMRLQGSGHLVQMSTQGGHVAHAGLGLYHASKWALEGLTESLVHELVGTGVDVTLVEPGAALTEWFTRSLTRSPDNPAYADVLATRFDLDPALMPTARAVVDAAMTVVGTLNPPTRLLLTAQAYDNVTTAVRDRLHRWAVWEDLARSVRAPGHPDSSRDGRQG